MKRLVMGIFLIIATVAPALAQSSAETYFSQGIEAFRSGKYEIALNAFERARKEGMAHPSLYYNMGVSAYRLARFEEAKGHFLQAAQYPQIQQLAYYNLGLVALKLNDQYQAIDWFDSALEGGNDKVRVLAATQLEQLLQRLVKNSYGFLGVSYGYDNNVIDPSVTTTTEEEDSFVELFAAGSHIFGSPNNGWRADASMYLMDYAKVDDLDLAALRLGVARVTKVGQWRSEAGIFGDWSTLGQDAYLATQSIELKGKRSIGDKARLQLRYRLDHISALDSQYDYLQGQRHRAKIEGSRDFGRLDLGLAYEYEYNDREDLDTGTTFSSYSPVRHAATVKGNVRLSSHWKLLSQFGYRYSDYDKPNRLADGTKVNRSDEQLKVSLRLEGNPYAQWHLYTAYDHTENTSNIDVFDYNRDLFTAGVSWAF